MKDVPVLSKAAPVFRRVPVVGAVITGVGIGADIAGGKDPGKAIASGTLGFGASVAAGAGVGAVIGGPVGLAAGAIVGAGVGAVTEYAVDEWAYDAAKDIGGRAWDEAGDATGWVGDKAGDAAGWAKDKIGGLFD